MTPSTMLQVRILPEAISTCLTGFDTTLDGAAGAGQQSTVMATDVGGP